MEKKKKKRKKTKKKKEKKKKKKKKKYEKEPKKRKKERKKERKKKTRPDKNILESWPDVGEGFIRRLFVSTWTHTKPRVNTFRDDPKMSHEGII